MVLILIYLQILLSSLVFLQEETAFAFVVAIILYLIGFFLVFYFFCR